MLSLRDLQLRFADALRSAGAIDARLSVYRNTVRANYRNALGATYQVVKQLVGTPFFNAAVDAYAIDHPSRSGDLNVYGDRFGDFLAAYPHARHLAYLPDVARLEWAMDCAQRAADAPGNPDAVLAALAAHPLDIAEQRFELDPSARFLLSAFPVLRIWQAHQPGYATDVPIDFEGARDHLLIRREGREVVIERLVPSEFGWLCALAEGTDLATAVENASRIDTNFDLAAALGTRIANRTLIGLR